MKFKAISDIEQLSGAIKGVKFNTFSRRLDKKGNLLINLYWDEKPDCDYGKAKCQQITCLQWTNKLGEDEAAWESLHQQINEIMKQV